MFFAAVPQTFLDKFIALAIDPATGKARRGQVEGVRSIPPGQREPGEVPERKQSTTELRGMCVLRHSHIQIRQQGRQDYKCKVSLRPASRRKAAVGCGTEIEAPQFPGTRVD